MKKRRTKNTRNNRKAARIGRMLSREYGIKISCTHNRGWGYYITNHTVGDGPLTAAEDNFVATAERRGTVISEARRELNNCARNYPEQLYAARKD